MMHRLVRVVTSIMPILIIAALIYAAIFIKPEPVGKGLDPPAISGRDFFYGMAFPTTMTIWAVGNNSNILRSDDAGVTWDQQQSPVHLNLQGIAAWDTERAVAVGNDGIVLVTGDGGKTWNKVSVPRSDIANKLLRVRIFNDVAWAVGEMGAVIYSKDYGATWVRAIEEEDAAYNDIYFIGDKGWLVGEFGYIKTTDDGGVTWRELPGPEDGLSVISVAFQDVLNGVAVGLEGMILVTHDGGETWSRPAPKTKEHLFSVTWDGEKYVAVGNKGMMVTSNSSCIEWEARRMAHWDLSWYTEVKKIEDRYYLAGASIGYVHKGILTLFAKKNLAE
jgi:photosystem II stability/assembly factor-like uncharacterized protein